MCSRNQHKELELLYAIPNGANVSEINRMRLVSEGMKKGMPDLCLPVAKGKYGSLFIELKTPKGTLTKYQKEIHARLEHWGNCVVVVRNLFQAIDAIEGYLRQS